MKCICGYSPEGESRDTALAGTSNSWPNPLAHNASRKKGTQGGSQPDAGGQTGLALQDVRAPGGCERYWVFTHSQADCFALQVIKQGSRARGMSLTLKLWLHGSAYQLPQELPRASTQHSPLTLSRFLLHLFLKLTQKQILPTKTSTERSESICNKNLCAVAVPGPQIFKSKTINQRQEPHKNSYTAHLCQTLVS